MEKVYQVLESFFFSGEVQETNFGTYSSKEKAEERAEKVKKKISVCSKHVWIKEITLDLDIN